MRNQAQAALRYLGASTAEELGNDDKLLSAILWRMAIVGEAAAQLSPEGLQEASGLPLKEAKRTRNLLVHRYPEIDVDIVFQTVNEHFPQLIDALDQLLKNPTA